MTHLKVLLVFLFITIGSFVQANQRKEDIPAIVPVEWLQKHYANKHLVLIDVRTEKKFKQGHLKHAVNMPIFKTMFDKNLMLPKLDKLQNSFSKAGIDDKSLVVVYGNNQLIWAARFYWVSEVLGHNDVGVLQVGYGNWKKGELPITTALYTPKQTHFIPRVDNSKIQTQLSTLLAIGKKTIIDGRPQSFYKGEKSHAKRFGHIPTALNSPGSLNYTTSQHGSKMKSMKELKALYKNLPKNKEVILYCEDGADAALNFLILQQLGYKASVYDGSWLEWGNNKNLPLAK